MINCISFDAFEICKILQPSQINGQLISTCFFSITTHFEHSAWDSLQLSVQFTINSIFIAHLIWNFDFWPVRFTKLYDLMVWEFIRLTWLGNNSDIFPWTVSIFQVTWTIHLIHSLRTTIKIGTLVFIFYHFAGHCNTKWFFNIQTKSWYPKCGWEGHICILILSIQRTNTCVSPNKQKILVEKAHKWSRHKVSM